MEELIGLTRLWQMVVYQAIMDSISRSTERNENYCREEARWWLTTNNGNFYEVCYLANLDPIYIQKEAIKVIRSNKRIRCERGKAPNYYLKKLYRMKCEEKRSQQVNNINILH